MTTGHPGPGGTRLGAPCPRTPEKGHGHTRGHAPGGQERPGQRSPARDSAGIPGAPRLSGRLSPEQQSSTSSPPGGGSRSSAPSARCRERHGRARLQRAAGGLLASEPQTPPPHTHPVSFCSFLPPPQDASPKGCSKTPRPAAGGPLIPSWEREQPCDRLCNALGSLTSAEYGGQS